MPDIDVRTIRPRNHRCRVVDARPTVGWGGGPFQTIRDALDTPAGDESGKGAS